MADPLADYENQLADVNALLEATPEDESLLQLKADLVELISLTKTSNSTGAEDEEQQQQQQQQQLESAVTAAEEEDEQSSAVAAAPLEQGHLETMPESTFAKAAAPPSKEQEQAAPPAKKLKRVKDFEIPAHLQPAEADTEAEKNKKRRAIKALKNKWRQKKKEFESNKKQQSWQNFNKKKRRKDNNKSIFATQEGVNAKVGVISGGSMTDFGARKRHKYT